jgi:hypothetical protein
MRKFDVEGASRRSDKGPTEAQKIGRHRTLAAPLMGPQAETLDRLMGRTEEDLRATDFRQRQSRLANVRAAYCARHSESKR